MTCYGNFNYMAKIFTSSHPGGGSEKRSPLSRETPAQLEATGAWVIHNKSRCLADGCLPTLPLTHVCGNELVLIAFAGGDLSGHPPCKCKSCVRPFYGIYFHCVLFVLNK
jgi:hypothetical protein